MPSLLTLEKSLNLIEAVMRADSGVGTRALAQRLGINVTTTHNIAMTLVRRGYLRQDPVTRLFYPGMRLMHLGHHPTFQRFLSDAASGVVHRFAHEINETVQLVANDQGRFINLAYVSSTQSLAVNDLNEIKSHNAHATAYGKLLLAFSPPAMVDSYLAHHGLPAQTPRTITDPEVFRAELAHVREQGYSHTCDEWCEGVSAIAVPVRDSWGEVFAALGASAPTFRLEKSGVIPRILDGLRQAATEIEQLWTAGVDASTTPAPPGNRRGRPRKTATATTSRNRKRTDA